VQPEGVIVGGLLIGVSALLILKRAASARVIAGLYRRHADLYPGLYPGPLRRWTTSEELWKVLVIPIALVWGLGGLNFFIIGMGWSN